MATVSSSDKEAAQSVDDVDSAKPLDSSPRRPTVNTNNEVNRLEGEFATTLENKRHSEAKVKELDDVVKAGSGDDGSALARELTDFAYVEEDEIDWEGGEKISELKPFELAANIRRSFAKDHLQVLKPHVSANIVQNMKIFCNVAPNSNLFAIIDKNTNSSANISQKTSSSANIAQNTSSSANITQNTNLSVDIPQYTNSSANIGQNTSHANISQNTSHANISQNTSHTNIAQNTNATANIAQNTNVFSDEAVPSSTDQHMVAVSSADCILPAEIQLDVARLLQNDANSSSNLLPECSDAKFPPTSTTDGVSAARQVSKSSVVNDDIGDNFQVENFHLFQDIHLETDYKGILPPRSVEFHDGGAGKASTSSSTDTAEASAVGNLTFGSLHYQSPAVAAAVVTINDDVSGRVIGASTTLECVKEQSMEGQRKRRREGKRKEDVGTAATLNQLMASSVVSDNDTMADNKKSDGEKKDILKYATDSESDTEMAKITCLWDNAELESSDAESVHTDPNDDPLAHANVYTDEEVTLQIRNKFVRMQNLYIKDYRLIVSYVKEKQREHQTLMKKEKESYGPLLKPKNMTESDERDYKKLKALSQYQKYGNGPEALLFKQMMERKKVATSNVYSKSRIINKCTYTEGGMRCPNKVLPGSKYCMKHLLKDPSQVLFRPCGVRIDDVVCQEPVDMIFHNAKCPLHRSVADTQPSL